MVGVFVFIPPHAERLIATQLWATDGCVCVCVCVCVGVCVCAYSYSDDFRLRSAIRHRSSPRLASRQQEGEWGGGGTQGNLTAVSGCPIRRVFGDDASH